MVTLGNISSVLGIISFVLTFFNLLGIYADAVRTVMNAPSEIRDNLANLRLELLEERGAYRRYRRYLRRSGAGKERSTVARGGATNKEDVLTVMGNTIRDLWTNFKSLERPFLVRNPRRAREIQRGDYWEESDLDEKGRHVDEERNEDNLKTYYDCDFMHRFLWWRSKAAVTSLMNQVQRLQIRRIEWHATETGNTLGRMENLLTQLEERVQSLDEKLMVVRRADHGSVRRSSSRYSER
ncbi:MAG: hypothetical protein Q9160_002336 [Pyrenula sp. 1 TL-2023]